VAVLSLGFLAMALGAEGDLDPGFGSGGVVRVTPLSGSTGLSRPLIQRDGKIIVCGEGVTVGNSSQANPYVYRMNPDGSFDTSFGDGGSTRIEADYFEKPCSSIVLQADGEVVAATLNRIDDSDTETHLVRLDVDGRKDLGFGTGGVVSFNFSVGVDDGLSAIAVQADGKIVIGFATLPNGFGIMRLHADGSVDSSFGANGRLSIDFPANAGSRPNVRDVLIDSQGRVLLGGSIAPIAGGFNQFVAVRALPNGRIDTAFGRSGVATVGFDSEAFVYVTVLQPNGRILMGGGTDDMVVARLLDNGSIDTSFGDGGTKIVPIDLMGDGTDSVEAILVRNDGRIVAVGSAARVGLSYFRGVVLELDASGNFISSFGDNGVRVFDVLPGDFPAQRFKGIAFQGPNYIIAGTAFVDAGPTQSPGYYNFLLRLDGSFGRGHSTHERPFVLSGRQ